MDPIAGLRRQEIDDDGVVDVAIGRVTQPVDVLDVFYRLRAIRKQNPATATNEEVAASQAAFLRSVRDEVMSELGFASPSLTAASKFAALIMDLVLDVKKNSGAPPTSNASAAPDSSAAE